MVYCRIQGKNIKKLKRIVLQKRGDFVSCADSEPNHYRLGILTTLNNKNVLNKLLLAKFNTFGGYVVLYFVIIQLHFLL